MGVGVKRKVDIELVRRSGPSVGEEVCVRAGEMGEGGRYDERERVWCIEGHGSERWWARSEIVRWREGARWE